MNKIDLKDSTGRLTNFRKVIFLIGVIGLMNGCGTSDSSKNDTDAKNTGQRATVTLKVKAFR